MSKTQTTYTTLIKIAAIAGTLIGWQYDFYHLTLCSFSAYLLTVGLSTPRFNERVFAFFFLGYLFIPFLNISEYRGIISTNTLGLYCATQFLFLGIFNLFEKNPRFAERPRIIRRSILTEFIFACHLAVIFLAVAYVYATIGPIALRQDLRFNIPPTIEYVIKSGLVLPLFWVYFDGIKPSKAKLAYHYLTPIIPSLLIGSRGTFIIILGAVILSIHLFRILGPSNLKVRFLWIYPKFKLYALIGLTLAIFALYSGFYIRRDGNDLVTATDALDQYNFSSKGILVKSILPIYMGLRETAGLTNRIIEEDIQNPTDVPLIYSELLTFLPGHQIAPGIVLATDIYRAQGTDEKYSLTPGIVGGIYLDYRYLFIPIIVGAACLILFLYQLGSANLIWRFFYVLTLIQFLHLYHRGFMKLEYLVPYIIAVIYMFTLISQKSSKSSRHTS